MKIAETIQNDVARIDILYSVKTGRYSLHVVYSDKATLQLPNRYKTQHGARNRARSILRNIETNGLADLLEKSEVTS